jgi:hypothetical protein
MTLPYQEHNSLLATREFLILLSNQERFPNLDQKIVDNAYYLLKHFPTRTRLDELYEGNTITDLSSPFNEESEQNPNKIVNNNQTWDTPGYKWKTEVEFVPVEP